ncbi:arsenic transporter [Tersicoccus solisilvae]|uniref:Arsenic transporter n=1 Tax=Tersicoccus solisilvae TaxID=1882339 RepID=A0ABQ1NX50_9MICC|nr:SLC13 family permease [Tersicoccus solisilvae]GGC86569.1 arsenic transporter [Tersicoccus solisilvae]
MTTGRTLTAAAVVAAAVLLVTGALPLREALLLADRAVPVLVFVAAMTVVTELLEAAGLFHRVAYGVARLARGRTLVLWALAAALCVVTTALFSLDTTAVLLTPVLVVVARACGLPVRPFALLCIMLANTASLFLPVSNLTNLLAQHRLAWSPVRFVGAAWLPAIVACVVPVVVLTLLHRRAVTGRYGVPDTRPLADPVLLRISQMTVVVLMVALVSGMPVWIPAVAAAVVLLVATTRRTRVIPSPGLVPWRILLLTGALFVAVETVHARGLDAGLQAAAAGGRDAGSLAVLAGLAAVSANVANNLPAYLLLEPAAGTDAARLLALLIGVNVGPLITPWASLATMLWHRRLSTLGEPVGWGGFAATGALIAVLTVSAGTLALVLVPPA